MARKRKTDKQEGGVDKENNTRQKLVIKKRKEASRKRLPKPLQKKPGSNHARPAKKKK